MKHETFLKFHFNNNLFINKDNNSFDFEIFLTYLNKFLDKHKSYIRSSKITFLRKLFYNSPLWHKYFFRGVELIKTTWSTPYPNLSGDVIQDDLNKENHRTFVTNNSYVINYAHLFGGLDALNNPMPLSPLPDKLYRRFYKYFIYSEHNYEATLWLGDIAAYLAAFYIEVKVNKRKTDDIILRQSLINQHCSSSQNLANIDCYLIHNMLKQNENISIPLIFKNHYYNFNLKETIKFFLIHENISFNENLNGIPPEIWAKSKIKDLRNVTAFLTFGMYEKTKFKKYILGLKIWLFSPAFLDYEETLKLFINSLIYEYNNL